MKHPLLWLLSAAIIAFIIAGFFYLNSATSSSSIIAKDARTPALVSGITCLCIGTGLLVLGVFAFRRKDRRQKESSGTSYRPTFYATAHRESGINRRTKRGWTTAVAPFAFHMLHLRVHLNPASNALRRHSGASA